MAVTVKPLSVTECNNAKPKEKEYSLSDGLGLFLLVRATGVKIWRFQYYKPFTKKRTLISLGAFPSVSLKEAREIRDLYRSLLAKNVDPLDYRLQQEKAALESQVLTLSSMATEWLVLKKNEVDTGRLKVVTYNDIEKRLNRHLLKLLGHYPIADISAPIAIEKLKPLERERKLDTLHRMIGYLNQIMIYAVNRGAIKYNPTADIGKVFLKPVVENNPTIRPELLGKLFEDLQNSTLEIETRCALELLILTAGRAGAITQLEWSEVNFEEKILDIPKEKMKGRQGKVQDFVLPLSTQAIKILQLLQKLNRYHSRFVFPSRKNPHQPISKETPNKALQRMGYRNVLTAHGLRSVFSTAMNEAEFNSEIIEVCLAHFEYSSVRGTYNKAKYLTQRAEYMQWWGNFVEQAAEGKGLCS
ncbi:tyrosine-type recombinase/integrase [Glaesserella parasuis]|nr:tyrosine-type recombinase/integrase [Glaesserella parasuis]AIK16847.1 preprotein translocase [Glaesserella parasuis]MDG6245619.1 tyrosine-type recombinase/integrase [Glaesserella parasuis]MDG6275409.1 tyrosine-type recombinase/integrase [Glaesserella parasuis]MDG6328486.1 tyrosine-type recombinase/integrase [Glaesserella parasuis]MDG6341242.1 tyrosine-type recombinase/integrase [Glaesserella parasuis]